MGLGSFYRYRSELAPAYWWLGALLTGAWLHSAHPGWWPVPILAAGGALVLLIWRPSWLLRRWPLLGRWRVRLWAAAFAPCLAATVAVAAVYGPTAGDLPTYSALAGFGLALPWWWREDRRRLTRVRLIRERFPETAEQAGLPGARMVSAQVGKWGWSGRVKMRRGQHYADAVSAVPALESALGSRVGSVRVEAVPDDAAEFVLRLVETDPHAQPIKWEPRTNSARASITDPVTVGIFEDGTPVTVSFLRRHVLIGGATDSGKSGLLNVILARIAECNDTVVWGVDLKKGMELAPWSKVLHRLADDNESAEHLLQAAVDELETRAEFLTARGRREWYPKFDEPQLFIMIDEYAELSRKGQRLADSIARRGRAVAVCLLIATQRPTQKTMGEGSALRGQMNVRFCLRVNEAPDVDLILGAGKLRSGWDTTGFDAPGKFLVSAAGLDTPRRGRAYLITDPDVTATATAHARPGSVADTAASGLQSRSDGPAEGPETTGAPPAVSGPEMALWAALRDAPAEGVTVGTLQTATGKGRSWVYKRLKAGQVDHTLTQPAPGRWRLVSPTRDHPGHGTQE
ncbi:FtsK/SpoIIIE domain-containing protein [Kribbella sp. NPDC051587]|uniref:FtsK/SpoIIIE domain-containing protein n=1 Tax=Kribbella sp. NPDC051587 TaxID=3364119 RepID=UPI00378EA820